MGETEKKKVDYGTVDVVAEIEHGRLLGVDNASNRTPPGAMPKGKRVKGEPKLCTMQREEKKRAKGKSANHHGHPTQTLLPHPMSRG